MDIPTFIAELGKLFWDCFNNFKVPVIGCSFLGLCLGILLIKFFIKVIGIFFGGYFGQVDDDRPIDRERKRKEREARRSQYRRYRG